MDTVTLFIVVVGIIISNMTLRTFGAVGAYYGRSPMVKGTLRVFIGGWMAMVINFGLLKLLGMQVDVYGIPIHLNLY